MKLLKSKLAWKRWAKKAYLSPRPSEPKEYPCFAMTVCTSCAYEETDGFYLYRHDLSVMLKKLYAAGTPGAMITISEVWSTIVSEQSNP